MATMATNLKRLIATGSAAAMTSVAFAAVSAAPALANGGTACSATGSRTEEASRSARVYSRVVAGGEVRRWYGCLYSADRRVRLGDVGAPGSYLDRISPVRLAGRYVATANEWTATTGDAIGAVIVVRDLRTGAVVHRFENDPAINTYDVTDLELRANGAVAWIARVVMAGTPATITDEVRTSLPGTSATRLLDEAPAVERRSLALSGRTLYWTSGGVPRSATLR